ncbi:MAG: type II toxin-antitoxin system VapC family toxin [Egibacteraceae bacterium]
MAVGLVYLDTSALTKLVVQEPETVALQAYLSRRESDRLVTSALARTELRRVALRFNARTETSRRQAPAVMQEVTALLGRIDLVRVGAAVLDRAGMLLPAGLRSLDTLHLATALRVGTGLRALVAYDLRLATAARDAGMPVAMPGA